MSSTVSIELLPLDVLTPDIRVQRRFYSDWAKHLTNNFNPDFVGTLDVSYRDGGYVVLDGQHRLAALKAKGYSHWECKVYVGLEPHEEAQKFLGLNTVRPVRPMDKFRVRINARDQRAMKINQAVVKAGWQIGSAANGHIAAVNVLEWLYEQQRARGDANPATIIYRVLLVVTEAWDHDRDGVRAPILKGIGMLLLTYSPEELDLERLMTVLEKQGAPALLYGNAKGTGSVTGYRDLSSNVAYLVTLEYNRGLRARKLPPWQGFSQAPGMKRAFGD